MFRDASLVAGKDLRIELRSQVTTQQVAPFAVLVLILFGVALDPDRGILGRASSGLFWVAVLFCSLLAIQRAFTIEAADGGRDALRLSGLVPAASFLGKAAAIFVQLLALEVVLAVGVVVMYGTEVTGVPVARLSAGQRRRTSCACLIARRPELWLLDEPHAELDRAERIADRTVSISGGSTPTASPPVAASEEPVLVP